MIKISKKILPLGWDSLFKKVYGDANNLDKVETLLSTFLHIPYEELKGKTTLLSNQKRLKNKNSKKQEEDVVLKVIFTSGNSIVNLEANIHGLSKEVIERNLTYLCEIFGNQLHRKESYDKIIPVIQINFTKHNKKQSKEGRIMDSYLLKNQYNEILSNKIQVIDIYIENCYSLWYNDDMEKFTTYEQAIIKYGALLCTEKDEEFRKCLGEIDMEEDVKTDIQSDMDEYQTDDDLVPLYDKELKMELQRQSYEEKINDLDKKINDLDKKMNDLDKKMSNLDEIENELEQERNLIEERENSISERENSVNEREKSLAEEKNNINKREQKLLEEKNNLIDKLKNIGLSDSLISKLIS